MAGKDEYLFAGAGQERGMSGGATVNGNGYTGMVHAIYQNTSMHLVIPAKFIRDCIKNNLNLLVVRSTCPSVEIAELPMPLLLNPLVFV